MSEEAMTTPLPSRLRESARLLRGLYLYSENLPVKLIDKADSTRIAAELTEAADALEAGPWMPIETAPKDGTMFLCWVSAVRYGETDEGQRYQEEVSQIDFCQWRTQADIPDCGWFEPFCGQIGDEQDVTLWAPLPVAPAAQVAQEGWKPWPFTGCSGPLTDCDMLDAAGVATGGALPDPKLCPRCCQYHGPVCPAGVPASEYLAKIKADPRRAAALQRATERARADGVAGTPPSPGCLTCGKGPCVGMAAGCPNGPPGAHGFTPPPPPPPRPYGVKGEGNG